MAIVDRNMGSFLNAKYAINVVIRLLTAIIEMNNSHCRQIAFLNAKYVEKKEDMWH